MPAGRSSEAFLPAPLGPRRPPFAALVLAPVLIGCGGPSEAPGPVEPALRVEATEARLLEPYEARVRLEPEARASFALVGGALPDGLTLREDGQVQGTPGWLGAFQAEVQARLASGDTLQATLSLEVVAGAQPVFPGFPRDPHPTQAGTLLLNDLWLRVAGGGEPGQDRLPFAPGLYLPGPDGAPEGGGGDDERVGDLRLGVDAFLGVGQWNPSDSDADDPATWDEGAGEFVAGGQAGARSLSFSAEGFPATSLQLAVVPPDWCPLGDHPRGGPSPGVCQ